ncbi:MAG TPA: autotransporter outer membrane beta-barrel domain-containing protein [Mesorhizobium sp.]|jgi:fibronectin-binding autotransporter adhesin|uniref:autotransporter outer membrane beta-barrel domain-containing protein n=1 Tax=Mesorhizobium sp. TaxID=1871066 RepID=UPI002DDDA358|nr:autotransporter outer membrane beta-barrel domain-containing protein [Mesorhizobium sp.]HEV2502817.1 autotransporter outer membrane beta-barrel domain-containing protein [Mesorhizobium sp.]
MRQARNSFIWSTTFLSGLAGSGLLFFPTSALANCTTVGGVTTCDSSAPNPYTTRVGSGPADNNRTVNVGSGATINVTGNNAISLGNAAAITIDGTVRNNASTPNGAGTSNTGNNTVEFGSNSTLTINAGGSIIAAGTSTNSEAVNPTGFGNTILNYGLIQATNSAAIWFEDRVTGAKNVVDNYGTIEKVGGGNVMGSSGSSGITFYNRTGARILGNLSFSGGNDDLIFEANSTASGAINGGGGTNNLTLQGAAGSNDILPGSITNFSTLTKDGQGQWTVTGSLSGFTIVTVRNGVLALTGNNAGYTGNLVVDPTGILEARAQSLPTKTPASANVNNVQNNGLVRFTQSDNGSYTGQITGSGSVVKLGAGVLTLTPAVAAGNTFLGGLSINQGTVAAGADNALGGAAGGLTFNGGTLQLNSSFDLATSRAVTINSAGGTIDTQAFQSTVSQGITGTGALTKAGSGTLVLNGANSYAGGTVINGGVVRVSNDGNLGAAAGGVTFNGGTLQLDSSFDINAGRALTVNAAGGTIDTQGFQSTVSQAIAGAGALTKAGTGTLTLTGANSYGGGTTIAGGTLQLGNGGTSGSITGNVTNNGTLAFNRSDAVTFGGLISGTGAVQQIGSGITTLTAANSYTGPTTVGAGTLIVNGNQSAATGDTSVNAGATIGGTGTIGGSMTVANGGTLAPGNVGTTPGTLTVNGAVVLNSTTNLNYNFGQANVAGGPFNDLTNVAGSIVLDGKLNVNLTPGGSFDPGVYRIINYGGALQNNTLEIASLPPGTPPGTFFVQTSVAQQVNLVNTAGLQLTFWDVGPKNNGAVNGGTGTWQNAGATDNWADQSGAVNAAWADSGFAVFMASPGTVTVDNGNGAVRAAGMQFASDGYVIQGGTLTLVGAPTSIIKVGDGTTGGAGYTATINSVLAGTTQLVKTDLGTLVLNGANTYTGGTAINGGTLQVSSDGNLGAAAGGLSIDGGTLRLGASFNLNAGRAITLNAGGGTVDTQGFQTTVSQGITGAGALTKTGTGTLVLSGANTYGGGTTINAGTLQLGDGGTSGSITGDVTNNGTLAFNRSDTATFAGVISGTGAVQQNGTGTTVLTATNSYTGGTTINAGTLQLGNGGTSGSIAGDVANNGTFAFNRSDAITFGGLISGTGAVQQIGSGITTLTGTNSYTGTTTVGAGTLIVNGNQTAATGATTVNAGATIGGTGTIGGDVTIANGGTLAPGEVGTTPGALTINGALALNDTSNLNYNFGQSNTVGGAFNDLTTVGGNLTLDGKLNVNLTPGGSFDAGIYRVISYGGALTNNTLDIASLPPGTPPGTFFVQTSVAQQVNLVNTAGLNLTFWDGDAGPKNDSAVNGGNGTWQNAGASDNWTNQAGTPNAAWADSGFAVFMATPGTVTVDNGNGAVRAAGMQFASDGYVIQGGTLTLVGAPSSTIRVGDGTAAGAGYTATINSVLDGATQLVKSDLGTLVLNGANTYTGGTAINGGTVQASSDGNLGAASGGLSFNGGTLRLGASFDVGTARAVTLNAAGGTVDTQGFQSTISQAITGAGALTKTGPGTLTLTGASSYAGGTTISAGTLQLGDGGTSGSITGNVANNGILAFNRSDVAAFAGVISGTGAVQQNGTGTTVLTAANSYTGGTTINAGTLQLGNGGSSGSIAGNVTNNGTLAFDRADGFTFGGLISGSGAVRQIGSGVTTLTAASTYSGATTVASGTLAPGGANILSASSAFSVLSGGTLALNDFDQTLASLSNAGLVDLGIGKPGTMLTIAGNYAGNGGTVQLATVLGGDNSLTDRLIVNGGTSGSSVLKVINAGGGGAPTAQGIKVVQVDGNSAGTFSLAGDFTFKGAPAVVAGAYAYRLFQGGVSTPQDGDWYLRSALTNSDPQYNPGAPVYEVYPQHLLGMNGLPTLQQRTGNRYWSGGGANVVAEGADAPAENPAPDGVTPTSQEGRGIWGRIEGAHNSIDPAFSTSSATYEQNVFRLQTGIDLLLAENEAGRLLGGIAMHYVNGKTDVTAPSGDGSIKSDGYGFSGTLTWYGNDGLYVDGQAQATWYDSDLSSSSTGMSLASGNNGFGYALSLETGKRFAIGDGLTLTPQAQLIYSRVKFDSFVDPFGTDVSLGDGDSLLGRLGVSLDRENSWTAANGTLTRSHLYGLANLRYEFLQGTRVEVATVDFANRTDRFWGEVGIGGSYNWNDDKYSVYGEGSVATSLSNFGDSNAIKGTLGFRVKW